MSLKHVRATFECDGCSKDVVVELTTGDKLYQIGDGSLHDFAEDAFRGGHNLTDSGFVTTQGDHHLCVACSRAVDDWVEKSGKRSDYDPTYDEVEMVLNDRAGV